MVARAVLDVALPVFAVAALGWVIAGWRRFDFRGINELLLYVAIPALLVHSLLVYRPDPRELLLVARGRRCRHGGHRGAGRGAGRAARAATTRHPAVGLHERGNFGLPLALLAWGERGLAVAVLYYVTAAVAQNTLGIWVARGGAGGWREMFRLPLPYAAVGITLAWLHVELPPVAAVPLEMLANAAIPLMLLSLGYSLRHIRMGAVTPALLACVVRMGCGLLTAVAMVALLRLEGPTAKGVILASSLPSAVLNVVLAQRYRADPEVTASAVLISTGVSLVAVPAVLAWLG